MFSPWSIDSKGFIRTKKIAVPIAWAQGVASSNLAAPTNRINSALTIYRDGKVLRPLKCSQGRRFAPRLASMNTESLPQTH